jgi:putative PIN family toxin of toxin-antitoxin system
VKLVLDTNVLIAAFISRGHSHELLEHVARHHELFTSEFILREFANKLRSKFKMSNEAVAAAVELLRTRMDVVEPVPFRGVVKGDPDDDAVLGTAVAADAECLLSGDRHLLELRTYEGIAIVAPASFWELERKSQSQA